MNYILHNYTCGYENVDGVCGRELILSTLKGYGLFSHLRDYNISHLGLYDVDKWLIKTDYLYDDILELKNRIEEIKKELEDINDDLIKIEWEKEVSRREWYNNPKSNYYTNRISKINNVLSRFQPQIETFNKYCDVCWIKDSLKSIIDGVKDDLAKSQAAEIDEANKRVISPFEIPSFDSFKEKYIKDKKEWISHFEEQIENKKSNIERFNKDNEVIKSIFLSLDLMEKELGVK